MDTVAAAGPLGNGGDLEYHLQAGRETGYGRGPALGWKEAVRAASELPASSAPGASIGAHKLTQGTWARIIGPS